MINADSITDEQIEELRGPSAESGDGYLDATGDYVPSTLVIQWCDDALSDPDPETEPMLSAHIRRNARAKLAEILNAQRLIASSSS